ncbi:MAG: hypothetical protein QXI19_06915 [Candidatus Caldarchaeum sp.]
MEAVRNSFLPKPGRVEWVGAWVTVVLSLFAAILGSLALAVGVVSGGGLAILNFLAIRMIVGLIVGEKRSKGGALLIVLVKMAVLVALVLGLFIFTRINIYGFLLGVIGVVFVVVAESMRGSKNGAF